MEANIGNSPTKNEVAMKARNTKDAIYFNFSYAALKLLGKNLYSNAANAISELVANSIDAKATTILVYIDMSDKEHSTIEILDNGIGMSYSDLAEKYVWIGRNKRNDENLTQDDKNSIMGRKGIGKLAALYLSNQYFILTKRAIDASDHQWEVNLSAYRDSDFPKMDRVESPIALANQTAWNAFAQGTAIKLNEVDLRRNGERRIESLRRVFADFYLLDAIGSQIYVAVKKNKNDNVEFALVEKKIAYKNFYALFDNSGLHISTKMSDSIAFTWLSKYENIANTPRKTQVLDTVQYQTKGKRLFHKEDGTEIEKEYQLKGWIAIHCTIDQNNAVDENFLRNNVYQPNRLRLYVRNKIAVEDYFSISPNTQAMANYIEGEISFNILDDDDLPDIATSSRQDFLEDERIDLLKSLVDPIVNSLFSLRNKIGRTITNENNEYEAELERQAEEKRKADESARAKAEKEKAEAEVKYQEAKIEANKYHAQSNIIFNAVTEDQKSFSAKTHLIKTNALTIRNGVATLARKLGIQNYKELGAISVATDKILSALKYSVLAKFNIEDEFIREDLFVFCEEYLLNVLSKQYFNLKISTITTGTHSMRFNPQYVSLLLDNLIANAEKSNSSEITVKMQDSPSGATIVVSDNGGGLKNIDLQRIFEFGYSNTGGTGIGLYNVKSVVEKMRGSIIAQENLPVGAKFVISFP